MTSYRPPTEAGMPKSVKQRKKDCRNAPASVPSSGRSTAMRKVASGLSPISLETVMVFLSMKPIVLWMSRKATGTV